MNPVFIKSSVLKNDFLISEHAHKERQMEEITVGEIKKVLLKGKIIEKYSKDARGESCLVGKLINDRAIHVVCGMRANKLLIVTVYLPKLPIWKNWKTRSKEVHSRV